jgi:lipopolysaccharide export system protein LptC
MRPWHVRGRKERLLALKRARQHSILVRKLRIAIPVIAIAGLCGLVLATMYNPLRLIARLPINPGKMVVSGSKITMEAPRLAGFTSDNRSYEMTAKAAAQDLANPNLVELKDIRAKVELKERGVIDVTAAAGAFDVRSKMLTLTQEIVLVSSTGYEARLDEATFDVQKGYIVSKKPVQVLMLNGTLNANRLEMVDHGAVARFDGGVSMTLRSNAPTVTGEIGGSEKR